MIQTILDLWNGNISPCEHCGSHDPEANKCICLIEQNRENLITTLTDAQRDLLQKYIDCSDDYLLRMMELAFFEGFSLGTKLTVESLR